MSKDEALTKRTLADVVETIEAGDFYTDYDQSVADLGILRAASLSRPSGADAEPVGFLYRQKGTEERWQFTLGEWPNHWGEQNTTYETRPVFAASPLPEPVGQGEAFLRLCEEIGIPATSMAYLEYRSRFATPRPAPVAPDIAEPVAVAPPVTLADWSNLPKDIYVTEAKSHNDIAFDVTCCSVPMMTVPEVRYTRAEPPLTDNEQISVEDATRHLYERCAGDDAEMVAQHDAMMRVRRREATLSANLDAMRRERDEWRDAKRKLEAAQYEHPWTVNEAARERMRAETAEAEVARLTVRVGELERQLRPQWFYPLNETSSDDCHDSESEVIDETLDHVRAGPGLHIVGVSYATTLPDKYHVVKVYSEEEKDARDDDEDWDIVASFGTDAEARALLPAKKEG